MKRAGSIEQNFSLGYEGLNATSSLYQDLYNNDNEGLQFPHRLSLYTLPPTDDIHIEDLERLAINRLTCRSLLELADLLSII